MMNVRTDFSSFRLARWYEYAIRFAAGGAATVIAGLLVEKFGPVFGGLFLAFPAILPCSVSLIESHETKRKHQAGLLGTVRGREAAGVDSAGASMGSLGMAAFAVVVWKLLPVWPVWAVFSS